MQEDKSLDLLGTKPLAKAVEKLTGKTIDGLGMFLGAICMPAAEEIGLLLRDKIATFRRRNLEAISNKTKDKIRNQNLVPTGDTNPQLLHQIIDQASWISDDNIQSMWAGLLAVASSSHSLADDSLIYTETLKRLTPFQAKFISLIYGDPRCCSVKSPFRIQEESVFYPENKLHYTSSEILALFPGDLSDIVPIAYVDHDKILNNTIHHGIAISRFRPQIEALETLGLIFKAHFIKKGQSNIQVIPCLKGLDFYMRCQGYNIYPLESFILTLQHWCKLRGVDPFTHQKV